MSDKVLLEVGDSGVATIRLNRPEARNAMNPELLEALLDAVNRVKQDDAIKVAVLTGEGDAFCVGADLKVTSGFDGNVSVMVRNVMEKYTNPITMGIMNMAKPWIGAINGVAAGGGCNLALAPELVVASEKASFIQVFASRGLNLDGGGSYLLPRLVGPRKAFELAYMPENIPACKAEELGMINRCLPHEQYIDFACQWAQELARGPSIALGQIKLGLHMGMTEPLDRVLEWEKASQSFLFSTEDLVEGMVSFMQKRPPEFKGK